MSDCYEVIGESEAENLLELEFVPARSFDFRCRGVVAHVGIKSGRQESVYIEVDGMLPVAVGIVVVREQKEA